MVNANVGAWEAGCVILNSMPPAYKAAALRDLEHHVSYELYHALQQVRNPCVVKLYTNEGVEFMTGYNEPAKRFSIGYQLTAVEHQHIVMPSLVNYESKVTVKPKVYTKFQKLWQRWMGSVWLV